MPYTVPTLAQARTELASRLNDTGMVRWISAELDIYIQEAIRTFAAWTSHFREQVSFSTVVGDAFYDLPTVISTLRQQTVTNHDLVTAIQYHLLEPATPALWSGTDQFTLAQVSAAIERRRDLFLQETGAVLTRSETVSTPPASGRVALAEAVLTVRRAAWRPTGTQLLLNLLRDDEWGATHYTRGWIASTDPPGAYSVSVTPPLTLQLIPPTTLEGTLDLVAVQKGATLATATAASLGIPNDWAWVVKWGALADLLQGDGLALDPQRAGYCEIRWQQGIMAAKAASVVLAGQIAGASSQIGPLSDADAYSPLWQLVPGTPESLLVAGQTLLAVWPPPGAVGGPWTITLDVVRNAPIPTAGGDILQIGGDVYDTILDYAQHLAVLKDGPGALQLSMPLLERVLKVVGVQLELQQASQPARAPILGQTRQDERTKPRELETVQVD